MTHVLVTKCRFENNLEAARLAGQDDTDTLGHIMKKYIGKYLMKGDITSTPVEEAVARQHEKYIAEYALIGGSTCTHTAKAAAAVAITRRIGNVSPSGSSPMSAAG